MNIKTSTKKRMRNISLIPLILLLLVTPVLAISCNPTSININYNYPLTSSAIISCISTNPANSTFVTITGTSSSLVSSDTIFVAPNSSRSINLSFSSSTPGNYTASLDFSDNTNIPLSFSIINTTQPTINSPITVFPTAKVVSVSQGSTKTQNVIISVPASYPRTVTIQAVDFNPGTDTIKFGDLNLGQILPGNSITIPIIFDGTQAQTGSYQTDMTILATDSQGLILLPKVSLTLQVTQGVSPTNGSYNNPPTCSLSSTQVNINDTVTFSCNNLVNNLDVQVPFNPYYQGVSVIQGVGTYTYNFRPILYGITNFTATYGVRGSSLFGQFQQQLRIASSGSTLGGTNLKFLFLPDLKTARQGDTIIVQLVDNVSNSLVPSPTIYFNSLPLTNQTGNSFFISLDFGKSYSFRGTAPGYSDLVQTIQLESLPLQITITPEVGDTFTNYNISANAQNVSLFIDGVLVNYPYLGNLQKGDHQLRVIKEGYFDAYKNITTIQGIGASWIGNLEKGVIEIIYLNKNTTWEMRYQNKQTDNYTIITSGSNDKIEFTPKDSGYYSLFADNRTLETRQIVSSGIFSSWITWIIIGIIVIIGLLSIDFGGGEKDIAMGSMGGSINR